MKTDIMKTPPIPKDTREQRKYSLFWILFCTVIPSSMGFLSTAMLNVALPTIQQEFSATGSQLLWFVNSYNLLLASLILIGGALGDRFGRKRVFSIGIILFTVGSLLCSLSSGSISFIVFRILQGLGGALMIPGSLAIITALVSKERRGSAIGVWSAATSAAIVGAPIIGGALANAGLWRAIFYFNAPLAICALIPLWIYIPENKSDVKESRIDILGAVLITAALAALSYGAIEQGQSAGQFYPWACITGGVILIGLFVWRQARISNPLMPLMLFKIRQFAGANLMTLFLYGALQIVFFFLVLNLIQLQGYNPQQAGFALIPSSLLLVAMSSVAGRVADRFGARLPIIYGTIVAGVGMWLFSTIGYTAGVKEYWGAFFLPIFLSGLGLSFVVTPLSTAVMNSAEDNLIGTASGINNAVSRAAGVLAVAIIGAYALTLFRGSVAEQVASLGFSPDLLQQLLNETQNLGNAQVPQFVVGEQRAVVETAYRDGFLRVVNFSARASALLCWISTVMVLLFFDRTRRNVRKRGDK